VRAGRLVLLVGLAISAHARDAGASGGRRFQLEPARDLTLTGGAFLVALLLDREKDDWTGTSPCDEAPTRAATDAPCDPARVMAVDRWVVEQGWTAARPASDALLATMLAAPLLAGGALALAHDRPAIAWGEDALVFGQTLGLTLLVTGALKVAARRPRPLTYDARWSVAERHDGDARLSFPSGHSAAAFASASYLAVLLLEREGPRPAALVAVTAGYLAAATVAGLRVAGAKHFLTDVLTGAAVGTLFGLGIPLLLLPGQRTRSDALGASSAGSAAAPVFAFGGAF
jgi:membrane-associated phospholipid phosphatase